MNLPLIDDDALFIDNSSLERFTTCPRSAQYYIVKKREGNEERTAIGFGKRVHEILDARYKFHPNVLPDEPGRLGTRALMYQRAEKVFADWTPPDDDFRTLATATRFIDEYNNTYPVEAFDVLHVELPFAVPLCTLEVDGPMPHLSKTIKVVWTGRIDLVYKREERIYIMDHKTTSMMGPSYFKEFEISSQVLGYVWATQKLLGVRIDGFCINALAFRKPTKTGKALELLRSMIVIDQALVDEWEANTISVVSNMVEMDRANDWPKHTKWCVGKYGMCEYFSICGLPPTQREVLLGSPAFRDVTWSPLT